MHERSPLILLTLIPHRMFPIIFSDSALPQTFFTHAASTIEMPRDLLPQATAVLPYGPVSCCVHNDSQRVRFVSNRAINKARWSIRVSRAIPRISDHGTNTGHSEGAPKTDSHAMTSLASLSDIINDEPARSNGSFNRPATKAESGSTIVWTGDAATARTVADAYEKCGRDMLYFIISTT
jgi:hypothetical protein